MQWSARHSPLFLGRGGAIDGQQRQILYLSSGLALRRMAPVVALDGDGPLRDELTRLDVEVYRSRMSSWRAYMRIFRRYVDARRLLELTTGREICLVHGHDVWRAEYARYLAKRLRVPYVVHVRGPVSIRDIQKHRLASADSIIAIAQRYADDLLAAGVGHRRIAVIDDAVDLSLFDPVSAVPATPSDRNVADGPVIGFVGRISRSKLVCEFLEMVALLPAYAKARPAVVIVGEWADPAYGRDVRASVSRLGLERTIRFVGRLPSREMPDFLAAIDVLVTLSGGSIMFEAMAMAKTVLSIRADGRHSLHTRHGETAWCLDTTDRAVCARELAQLVDDEELRRHLGSAARARVVRNLSIDTMVTKTADLYDRLAKQGPL